MPRGPKFKRAWEKMLRCKTLLGEGSAPTPRTGWGLENAAPGEASLSYVISFDREIRPGLARNVAKEGQSTSFGKQTVIALAPMDAICGSASDGTCLNRTGQVLFSLALRRAF